MERAGGDVVFFVDADDLVQPEYFRKLSSVLTGTGADFVLSSFGYAPLKRSYDLRGNAQIRAAMLPAFFGYSFDDVRRWNRGERLDRWREQGSVCRAAFRREFIERHHLRFDENLRLYEDSPFLAECAARAERVFSIPDELYLYTPGPEGILATSLGTARYWAYKFAALANRKAIAGRVGGEVLTQFAGSAVFSTLELLRAKQDWRAYLSDPFVTDAVKWFPTSWRHPLVAAAVRYLRCKL